MKHLGFTLLIILLGQLCFAQEETENQSENTPATEESSLNEVRYIRDYLWVPLRSGESTSHRIVHKGLKSGTPVTLLRSNEESQYSLVRTSKGVEGWIPSQYLIDEPTSAIQLKEAQNTIKELTTEAGPLGEKLVAAEKNNRELSKELKKLEQERNQLTKELERIKELSTNAIQLDNENKRLLSEYQAIKNKRDTLTMENQRLEDKLKNDEFINGALAVIFGIIATLIIQYLAKSNRRSSEWR